MSQRILGNVIESGCGIRRCQLHLLFLVCPLALLITFLENPIWLNRIFQITTARISFTISRFFLFITFKKIDITFLSSLKYKILSYYCSRTASFQYCDTCHNHMNPYPLNLDYYSNWLSSKLPSSKHDFNSTSIKHVVHYIPEPSSFIALPFFPSLRICTCLVYSEYATIPLYLLSFLFIYLRIHLYFK